MGNKLSRMEERELRELFDEIDLDKNREIDRDELAKALHRFGLPALPVPFFFRTSDSR